MESSEPLLDTQKLSVRDDLESVEADDATYRCRWCNKGFWVFNDMLGHYDDCERNPDNHDRKGFE